LTSLPEWNLTREEVCTLHGWKEPAKERKKEGSSSVDFDFSIDPITLRKKDRVRERERENVREYKRWGRGQKAQHFYHFRLF
jgi:hypothetical protein